MNVLLAKVKYLNAPSLLRLVSVGSARTGGPAQAAHKGLATARSGLGSAWPLLLFAGSQTKERPHPQPATRPTISFSKPSSCSRQFPHCVLLLRLPAILPGPEVLLRPR